MKFPAFNQTAKENFFRVLLMALIGTVCILICAVIPVADVLGVAPAPFLCAILLDTVLFLTVNLTGHLYGAFVLTFLFPVLRFFIMGAAAMASPVLIVPEIMSRFLMLLTYKLIIRYPKKIFRFIGIGAAALVNYGVLWLVVDKLLGHFIEMIMIFQNVNDQAGFDTASALMKGQSLHGQLIAALLGGLLAYVLYPKLRRPIDKIVRKVV